MRAVSWRSGLLQLPVEGATITSVLDELNRYTDKRILIRNPKLTNMKVGGAFNTRDMKSAVHKLQMAVPAMDVNESEGSYTLDLRPSATERN